MSTEIPESHTYLLDTDVATLATIGPDGRPQLSAVWFLVEDGTFRVSMNDSRQKLKNLRANAGVNLFVLDKENPGRYLEVRGDATLEADPDYVFADKVGAKYGGADLRTFDQPGQSRVTVTINPTRVNAVAMY